MQTPLPRLPGPGEVQAALTEAHRLVQQGQPLQALRLVAEVLRAVGLEREAGESVTRVQQALSAGSGSAEAADQLAGLLSLISLQQTQQPVPVGAHQHTHQQQGPHRLLQQAQQHRHLQPPGQQQWQPSGTGSAGDSVSGGGSGLAAMETEWDGSRPGQPAGAGGGQLAGLVAVAEGASCTCPHCGGVVAAARYEVHMQAWCPALHGS